MVKTGEYVDYALNLAKSDQKLSTSMNCITELAARLAAAETYIKELEKRIIDLEKKVG